jgi:hypothetical protein
MKKLLLVLVFSVLTFLGYSQVVSISPNTSPKGNSLQTTITLANGTLTNSSAPMGATDVYLQQGATVIYVNSFDPAVNVYPGIGWPWALYTDSMHVDWTIPLNVPSGNYDVHVITYQTQGWPFPNQVPVDNVLTNGFYIGYMAGTIEGDIYSDVNKNGIRDNGEVGIPGRRVSVAPLNIFAITNNQGHYVLGVDTGTYTVTPITPALTRVTSLPTSYTVSVPPTSTGNDFGEFDSIPVIIPSQDFSVWHHPMRCNVKGYTYITKYNSYSDTLHGKITIIHSPNLPFVISAPMPDLISGDTVIWNYSNFLPGDVLIIGSNPWISFMDPNAGDTIWYQTIDSVFDNSGNFVIAYTDYFTFVVSCSCDPNEKFASPEGYTSHHYNPMNTDLHYTVNFQNTGNDTAFVVVIRDTLDADLDWSTLKVTGSSDPVSTSIDANGAVAFSFYNILLPDSNVDEPNSHGFVLYSILPKANLPDPTVITNTAHIFFDYNSAVVTNTALTTLTNQQFPDANFSLADPTICQNSCVTYTNNSTSATSYAWSFPGGTPSSSTSANPGAICYLTPGQYNAQLIVSNIIGTDTLLYSNYVTVSALPTGVTVNQVGDTLWAPAGFTAYQWFFQNDSIQGATGQYYVATANGDYALAVSNAGGCTSGLNIPNVITSLNELIDAKGTTIYPNPTSAGFEISFSAFARSNAKIEIVNSLGAINKIQNVEIIPGINKVQFNDPSLSSGIYSIRIVNGNQIIVKKLVVE